MELMTANRQWLTRPDDERFLSLTELHENCRNVHEKSSARVVSSRALTVVPVGNDHKGLQLNGPNGKPVDLTHWSFGQLAARAGTVNATDLRKLPSELAADCLNYGLKVYRDVEDIGVLLSKFDNTAPLLRSVNGPNYGRIWNDSITGALLHRVGDGLTGRWRIPGEFGHAVPITKETTTLYGSDRDVWVFLADEQNRVTVPNRRNGQSGTLARGFIIGNSEVGGGTFDYMQFFFDYMCANHIIWGVDGFKQIKIRHTKGAPDRYVEEAMPQIVTAIEHKANSSVALIEAQLKAAQRHKVEKVEEFLAARFSRPQVAAIQQAHMTDEDRPIESLWDVATAITAYARVIPHADKRIEVEREAGKVLDLAA